MAVSKRKKAIVYERDGNQCVRCKSIEKLSIDHIIPLSKGGSDEIDNLRVYCQKCNFKKGNFEPNWKERLFWFFVTRREVNNFRNELLGILNGSNKAVRTELTSSFNQRIGDIKPKITDFLNELKRGNEVRFVGLENSITIEKQESTKRDDRVLQIAYALSDRLEAMERYLDVEYVEEEFKGYRKKQ